MGAADTRPQEFVWGPTLDVVACTDCGACIEFCENGVYEWDDGRVKVAQRSACIVGCSHCAMLCDAGALSFPSLDELRASRRGA